MKTVLILYDKGTKKNQRASFEDLYAYAQKKNILLCRAPIKNFDPKTGLFREAQFFESDWTVKKNIRPDVVYDKSPFFIGNKISSKRKRIATRYPFYNDLGLSKLLSDKWLTYQKFKDFSPASVLIKKKSDLTKIKKLKAKKVILKPLTGSGGKGIQIADKDNVRAIKYPFLAQELIEAKQGISGFVSGPHDLRVIIINEKIFYSFLRIPPKNKLISNLSQGGTVKVVPLDRLPSAVFPFIRKIQSKLKKYGTKLYSIDMIIDDNQRPWIIEMNSRPGITLEKEELGYRKYFFDNLINFWKN